MASTEAAGGYCIYAAVGTDAGTEEALTLHWVAATYIGGTTSPIDDSTFGTNTSGLDQFQTQLQIVYSQEVLDDSTVPVDYSYNTGNAFGAAWYQPKSADYFINQQRFETSTSGTADSVIGYHYDGSTWYAGSATEVTLGAAGLVTSSAVFAASVYVTLF